MFGSAVLDVAIGITLLFLFVSLICSAMREAIETVMKSRAMDLERGIREILHDQNGTVIAERLYKHPFIFSLFSGTYDAKGLKPAGRLLGGPGSQIMPWRARANLPTYIPSEAFTAALIDLVQAGTSKTGPLSIESLRDGAGKLQPEPLRQAVLAALDAADGDLTKARKNIAGWYDATMDRVSGWYKRRTQFILLALGLATAVGFNIDAVNVARHLATDKAYRDAVVAQAGAMRAARDAPAATPADAAGTAAGATAGEAGKASPPALDDTLARMRTIEAELDRSGFLLGWWPPQLSACDARGLDRACVFSGVQMVLGWLATAFAVSLGAPFWFDLLNKFMIVRSTVKPAEKSGREASKDSSADQPDPIRIVVSGAEQKLDP